MEEGKNLFDQLNNLFLKDPLINEFGFVTLTSQYSQEQDEDQPFAVIEHKLAISFACIPPLQKYAFTTFLSLLPITTKLNEASKEQITLLLLLTRTLLLVNADCYTALNARKKVIQQGLLKEEDEIKFLNLLFTKHTKSSEAWSHRRWLLQRILSKSTQDDVISVELKVCKRVAEIYPKNYHAWTHRLWVLSFVDKEKLLQDLQEMEDWTKRNVSDHCGFHHREFILLQLLKLHNIPTTISHTIFNTPDAEQQIADLVSQCQALNINSDQLDWLLLLWIKEFYFVDRLILLYPGHETMWLHKRFLIFYWMVLSLIMKKLSSTFAWSDEYSREISEDFYDDPKMMHTLTMDHKPFLQSELAFAEHCIQDDGVSHYEAQKKFAALYQYWTMLTAFYCLKRSDEEHPTIPKLRVILDQIEQENRVPKHLLGLWRK